MGIDYTVVQEICLSGLKNLTSNQKKHFKGYVKKDDKTHLPTQLAYIYAELYMTVYGIDKNIKKDLSNLQEEYDMVRRVYEKLKIKHQKQAEKIKELEDEVENMKPYVKKAKEYDSVIDKLHPDIRKLFNRGPSCFDD